MMVLLEAFQKHPTSTFEFLRQFCIQDFKSLLFTVPWGYMYEQYRLVLRTQKTYQLQHILAPRRNKPST